MKEKITHARPLAHALPKPQELALASALPKPKALPLDGFSRWNDLRDYIPMSRESVRLRELAGRFPKRMKFGSSRCVGWLNRDIHAWLADADGYRAPVEG
ncbi:MULTISPECIES: helix-turn-helix transcriptional regulator [Burkholderia]|uniref:helix-turn-helix transcriptional regulator n=1 Tax=Burkholderia TaxID=32008 RepID=UPI0009B39F7D|nr:MULTISPECIES: AlpA family phage regulatory protein [Burkholderia]MCL4670435.1 AlpA family phage regulatory protein [Burkholderia pseudomallei]PAJ90602.1 AlpA family phage regulatory protein [Burkholderia ubonensis]PAK10529.1 AlpA family phage regulatory protein [Burkholderia ubonensis]RQP76160.1 AlpA family phage regulatory protein [Burkholderia ubonensis]RQP94098.1 AlpA family phage regulatory protein [Burkholderia ubonensis]